MSDKHKRSLIILVTLALVSSVLAGIVLTATAQDEGCAQPAPTDTSTITSPTTTEDGGASCHAVCDPGACEATATEPGVQSFSLLANFGPGGGTIDIEFEPEGILNCPGDTFSHAPQVVFFNVTGDVQGEKAFTLTIDKSVAPPKGRPQFRICAELPTPFKDYFGVIRTPGLLPDCGLAPCQFKTVKKNGNVTISGKLRQSDPHLK